MAAARRQRCVHCWKLFWPNYRNRTKVKDRQQVCPDCGPVVGHRYADQRYRLARVAPSRAGRRTRTPAPSACSVPVSTAPGHDRAIDTAAAPDLASRVHAHHAAIAELVDAPARPLVSVPVERLPIDRGVESDRQSA
jgi:DNA-directed RNA polymerase subunit RPC12/RpoP